MITTIKSAQDNQQSATTDAQIEYTDVRAQWKSLAGSRKITPSDITALCLYRSLIKGQGKEGAISRLKKAFIPITNEIKLANGAAPYGSLQTSLYSLKYSTFITWLKPHETNALLALAKEIKINGKEVS